MPNKNKNIIDKIDHQILEMLQNTGRDSASHIANEIGMSIPAVSERIHKLEQNGIISGYEAIIDPKKVGLDVSALKSEIEKVYIYDNPFTFASFFVSGYDSQNSLKNILK